MAGRFDWRSFGIKPAAVIETSNGIAILANRGISAIKSSEAISKELAELRSRGGYDVVILDGPARPWSAAEHGLIEAVDGLVAVLPVTIDINQSVGDIIAELGDAERKLVGFVLSELYPVAASARPEPQLA
jgi:hypothetical protein